MLQRATTFLLIGLLLLGTFAGLAFADEEPAQPPAAEESEDAKPGPSIGEIQTIIDEHPWAVGLLLLGRVIPLIVGVVLLVLLYLRADKIRGGLRPPDAPNPPPQPYEPSINIGLAVGGTLVLPLILATIWKQAGNQLGIPESMAITGLSALPVGILVVMRRHRLSGERIPNARRSLGIGLGTFCIALVAVLPLTLIWAQLLMWLGHAAPVQELVTRTAFSPDPMVPICIAVFGVLIAPFIEESVFRGLLYPTVRDACGGGRRGILLSAAITSVIFAAMHQNLMASVGLFSLAFVLALVYEKTNSLATVIIAHATNNLLTLVPLLLVRFG